MPTPTDPAQIKDKDSLQAWLENLPQETEAQREEARRWAVAIAHRAAMRVLPVFWAWIVDNKDNRNHFYQIGILRPMLLANILAAAPSENVWNSAQVTRQSTDTLALVLGAPAKELGITYQASVAFFAASNALNAASKTRAEDYLVPCVHAATMAVSDDEDQKEFWSMLRNDIEVLSGVRRRPATVTLWNSENNLTDLWKDLSPKILAQGDGWRFWVEWYENALHGRPQDWGLLTKIALIAPEDWDKGADHVNALIVDIRLKHLVETRPLGEDAIDKGPDGLWHRTGQSDIDRDILQDAIDSVLDEIHELRQRLQGPQGNMFTALMSDLDLLEQRIARHPDRPLRLHDLFQRVQRHIVRNLENRELPDDDLVRDLSSVLGNAALDMCNACAKTQEVVQARITVRFSEADAQTRTNLAQIADAAATLSDASLAQEFREDAEEVADGAIPMPEKTGTLYRLQTRLAKIVTQDGSNLVNALVLVGALQAGVDTYTWIVMTILRFILGV